MNKNMKYLIEWLAVGISIVMIAYTIESLKIGN